MIRSALLLVPFLLAACERTPYEACLGDVRRSFDGEIAQARETAREAEGNLARGFALRTRLYEESVPGLCEDAAGTRECVKTRTRSEEVAFTIDRAAEADRLRAARATLARLQPARQAAVRHCTPLAGVAGQAAAGP